METLILLMVIPLLIPYISKFIWPRSIHWKEMLVAMTVSVLVGSLSYSLGLIRDDSDTEILTGSVLSKSREEVSCSHSYSCHCYTICSGSGQNQTCSQHCSTCYDHAYDVSWYVKSNIGSLEIDRIDRQGLSMPSRWKAVRIGEPFSLEHRYTNYVKAAPESLFHSVVSEERFKTLLPKYPQVTDYYRADHLLTLKGVGISRQEWNTWNLGLREVNSFIGPRKQAHAMVLVVPTADLSYFEALRSHWLGGKKNDIIVVIGSTKYPKIDWVQVLSWTDSQLFKVQLRDRIQELGNIDPAQINLAIKEQTTRNFVRKPAADFAYLKDQVQTPLWALVLAFVMATLTSVALTYFFYHNDDFH